MDIYKVNVYKIDINKNNTIFKTYFFKNLITADKFHILSNAIFSEYNIPLVNLCVEITSIESNQYNELSTYDLAMEDLNKLIKINFK